MTPLQAVDGTSGRPAEPNWGAIFTDELHIDAARAYWREIVSEMADAETLASANGHMIKRLVLFRIEFDLAAQHVAEGGKVIKAKKTAVPQISAHWTCMKQAADTIAELEAELGVSPRRRNAASKVNRGKKKITAAADYLRSVPK